MAQALVVRLKPPHGAKLGEDKDSEGDREGDARDVVGVLELCKHREEPEKVLKFSQSLVTQTDPWRATA